MMFGGGKIEVIQISGESGQVQKVRARTGFLNSRLAVISDGRIGVPYWENQLVHKLLRQDIEFSYSPDLLIYQVLPDLYTALRQTLHILYGNYGRSFTTAGEKQRLNKALSDYLKVNDYFLGLRKRNYEQIAGKIQALMESIIAQVGPQPRDSHKRRVIDFSKEIAKVKDSLERVNPGAKLSQLVVSREELKKRIEAIIAIEPYVMARRQTLKAIIEYSELKFRALEDFLKRLLPKLNTDYFSRHNEVVLRQRVLHHLISLADDMLGIDLKPFVYTTKHLYREIGEARLAIGYGEYEKAREILTASLASLKLRVVRTDIENFITYLTQLMFKPQRTLSPAELNKIRNGFLNLRKRLGTIDESRFSHKICKPALALISAAEKVLKRRKKVRAQELAEVKSNLVKAAKML